MDSLNNLFNNEKARFAQKALDYLDDKQLQHVIEMLDHPTEGRKQWRDKGLRPLYRNITKNIVHKSALLYKDGLPTLEVYNEGGYDERSSVLFNDILEEEMFVEFMTNFDMVLRLLKTAIILTQYNEFDQTVTLDVLHRGNAIVKINPFTKRPYQLIYKTGSNEEAHHYRIITVDTIEDWIEKKANGSKPQQVQQIDNPYGVIPITTFYDTNLPRTGYWTEAPMDLVRFNDSLNQNLIDLEYAASWSVHQTLFTNCLLTDDEDDSVDPNTVIGGLGKVVALDTTGVDSPFVEYKGPVVDLTSSNTLFMNWTKDVANDWAVTIKQEGLATQNISGFSLIVQEKDNLELRQQRQRMQETGLQRFYKTFTVVYNTHNTATFVDDTHLEVEFAKPMLPFDEDKYERIWTDRIASGKASVEDYLMEKHRITREEAIEMAARIRAENFESDIIG